MVFGCLLCKNKDIMAHIAERLPEGRDRAHNATHCWEIGIGEKPDVFSFVHISIYKKGFITFR